MEPGALLVIAAAICWGTTGTLQALAPASATSLSVGAVRLVVGGAALILFALTQGAGRSWRSLPLWPTIAGAAAMAAYQLTFFAGVRQVGVVTGTLVAIGSAPVFAGLLTWMLWRRAPGWRWALATLLAIAGCTLIVLARGDGANRSAALGGLLLAAGAGASYVIYSLFSAAVVRTVPSDLAAAATFGLGALFLAPVLAASDTTWIFSARGLAVALALGLVATALAYLLYTRALRKVPVSHATTLALAEPLVATLLGVLLLGERLSLLGWSGVALLFAGLAMLTVVRR
jgi:DME family drug/metabolite transporter